MRDENEEKWETVADNTRRLRVPGGWIYRVKQSVGDVIAVTFVPDPEPKDPKFLQEVLRGE